MSSDSNWKASACTGKQSYSLTRARQLARAVGRRHDEAMQAYHCPFCHGWHVGHPRRQRRSEKRRRQQEKIEA